MADNKNELMKDAELDKVVGGSGIECIGLLSRLKDEGLYNPTTPLVAGNERAAANELKTYLDSFTHGEGGFTVKFDVDIYSDGKANSYGIIAYRPGHGDYHTIGVDELIDTIKKWQR